jgi:hypothetical protein
VEEGRYNYARDGFVYLLSYATLLISSVGLNFLLKAIVAKFIPDSLQITGAALPDEAVIGFMAATLISFPIFTYLNFVANRMLKAGKMKPESGVRNWLLYITMVVVILTIIWQIVQLFIGFFNGVLAVQFVINTLITLAIAITILGYQWWHLRTFGGGHEPKVGPGFRIFEWIVYIVVAGAVIGSFFIIGTPAERRAKTLDNTRVERLSNIQSAVQDYYGFKGGPGHQKLPVNFDQLIADANVYIAPDGLIDPVTKQRFEYKVTGAKAYELCAAFDTVFSKDSGDAVNSVAPATEPASSAQRFYHGVGRKCFSLIVN